MNEDRPQEESNLPPLYAQLGEFSKLPAELRFQIWDCLFANFFKYPSKTPRALSILSWNRSLYEETSRILYERRVLELRIRVGFGMGDMKLHFTDHLDDILRLIRNFPSWRFQKCGPRIYLFYNYWLNQKDELRLWECVHEIVNTLKLIPNGKNITFRTFLPWPHACKKVREPEPDGELIKWFHKRFPGEPVPRRSCNRLDDEDHDYPPGPYLKVPVYHYMMLQAIDSFEQRQLDRDRLEESAAYET
ncbi:unnamed protein product [Penicillium bialowiezense]